MNIKRVIFLASLFFFLLGSLFLFKSSSSVSALTCTWGCAEWKTTCTETCKRAMSRSYCRANPDDCESCAGIDYCFAGNCDVSCTWKCVKCNPEPPPPGDCSMFGGDTDGDRECDDFDPCPKDKTNTCEAATGDCQGDNSKCPSGMVCQNNKCVSSGDGGATCGSCETNAD